ncbi:Similar to hypothetical protein [Tuber melanosporum Mel28]; acc. no. XP_002837972 [Pyronema omphalodes CBS 100304]|uniref:Uncharacterized protein n=1 Tax=Pyronema omphalodes (strain CBS 100304) TaxID=1076935 RepID=U4LTA7_PYROM|nr:Similar to hypothetical protein [Tuber melanosporum Mel28]; acc. no. XP_002837972 [Pyronema omphalodes CBS 100304]
MATPPIIPPRPSRSKSPMPRPSISSHDSTGSLSGISTPSTPNLDSQGGIPQIGKRVPMYPNAGDVQAPSDVALPGLLGGKKKHVYREEWEMDDGAYGSLTPKAAYNRFTDDSGYNLLAMESLYRRRLGSLRIWREKADVNTSYLGMSSSDLAASVAPTQSVSFQDGVPDEELGYIASEHYAAVISRAHSPAPEEGIHIDDPGHGGVYRRGTSTAPSRAQSDHGDNDDEEERQEGYSILAEDEVQKRQSAQGGMMPAVGSVQVPQRPKSRPQSGMRIGDESEELAGSPTGSPAPGLSSLAIPVKKTGYKTPYEELSPADENEKPLFPDSDDEKDAAAPEPPKRPVQSHHFPSNDHYTPNDELESTTAAAAAARKADDYNPSLNSLPEQDDSLRRLQQPDTPGAPAEPARSRRKFPSNDTWEDADDQVEEIEPSPDRPTTGDPSAIPEDAFPAVVPPAQHPAVAAEAAAAAHEAALAPVVPASASEPREPLSTPAIEGVPHHAPTIPSIPARPTTSAPLSGGISDVSGVETPHPISVAAAAAALAAASAPALKPKPAIPARPQRVEKKWPPVQTGGEDDVPVEHKAPPAVPSRPKPVVPVRPGKLGVRSGSQEEGTTMSPTHGHGVGATAVAAAGGVAALAAAVSSHAAEGKEKTHPPPPPTNKPKPPVPPRVGGKIAALKKGLDLEGRLRMGPGVGLPGMVRAASPASPSAEEGEKAEKEEKKEEEKPLVAASAGRARGPRGRKLPTATAVKKEEVKEKVQKLEIAGPWVNWSLDEELDVVVVEVKEEEKPAEKKVEEVKEEKKIEEIKEEPKEESKAEEKAEEEKDLKVEPKDEIEKLFQKPAVETAVGAAEEKEEKAVSPVDGPAEEEEEPAVEEKPTPTPAPIPEPTEESEVEEDEIKEDPVPLAPAAPKSIELEEIEEEKLVINPAPIPSAEEIEELLEEEGEKVGKEIPFIPERPAAKDIEDEQEEKEEQGKAEQGKEDEEKEQEKHEIPVIPERPAGKEDEDGEEKHETPAAIPEIPVRPTRSAAKNVEKEDEEDEKPSVHETPAAIPVIPQRPTRPAAKVVEKEDEDEEIEHPEAHTALSTAPGVDAAGAVQAAFVSSIHTDKEDAPGHKETVIPKEEHLEDAQVKKD